MEIDLYFDLALSLFLISEIQIEIQQIPTFFNFPELFYEMSCNFQHKNVFWYFFSTLWIIKKVLKERLKMREKLRYMNIMEVS